ncbi:MAG: calcium/sodium antiporter [Clostridia bacterium]|nr:calcium/sodium antiporter [Clostridia bacterium]MBP3681621.1 calcium/sodium antiporter [Clostridia bacterium]
MLSFILLIAGLALLVKCADIFVDGSSNIAKAFGIPSLIIGLTIVAFGTSAPEAAVSITAGLQGSNEISIGNVVGSNICNSLLILGICGLFKSLKAKKEVRKRDFPYYLLSALVLFIIVAEYFLGGQVVGHITRTNGLILFCFLGIYLVSLISDVKRNQKNDNQEEKTKFRFKDIAYIVLGLAGIILGGQLVVNSATEIAQMLGVAENVIALTIVAIGTSLPELVTSIIATRKGEVDIAVGNVIGSNIFNILFILGITSVICPLSLDLTTFIDIAFMLGSSILVYIMLRKNNRIGWKKGICMLGMYVVYTAYILCR